MRKYFTVFKLSWQSVLEYRFNFLLGRVRGLLFLLTAYFLWISVFKNKTVLFGFREEQIITYVLGAALVSSFIFDYTMDNIANSISRGELSSFLLKPINFLLFQQVKRVASTLMRITITSGVLAAFLYVAGPQGFLQKDLILIVFSVLSLILAQIIFTIIDSLAGILSFWTLHAYGPRFALKVFMDLTSGRIFPLSILPNLVIKLVSFFPFSYLVFFPINIYLGRLTIEKIILNMSLQVIWIIFLFFILRSLWKRGLKIYEAIGI